MNNAQAASAETRNDEVCEQNEQFPVNTYVTKVYFDSNSSAGDILRIVAMSNHTTTNCTAYHEYHHGNTSIAIDSLDSFTLRSGTLASSQGAINSFVSSMPLHIETAQAPSWTGGVRTPTGAHNRLFKAADPDDNTKMIGVLIEQNTAGELTRLTWYKTQEASAIFATTPTSLEFHMVRDYLGAASVDPNDIAGWTWYYTTTIAVGP
jgi:hypothetical protein